VRFAVTSGSETWPVEVVEADGGYRVRVGEEWLDVDACFPASGPASLLIGGASYLVDIGERDGDVLVTVSAVTLRLRVEEPGRGAGRRRGTTGGGEERLVAPMPGRVVAAHVRAGDCVEANAPLIVLEAMKMENEFRATTGGVVSDVGVVAGQAVNAGDVLVVIRPKAG